MAQRIIYPNGDNLSVIIPSGLFSVDDTARKDVPEGMPYLILDEADFPADRSQRDLWTADFSEPDGHGIGPIAWLAEQEAISDPGDDE